jgi:DNA-binding CsgD family transcriptional regulator
MGNARKLASAPESAAKTMPYEEAYAFASEAFDNAEYAECRRLLRFAAGRNRAATAVAALLEARCARYEWDVEAWYAAADRAFRDHPEATGRLEALALRSLARFRQNRLDEANTDVERLREMMRADPCAALGWPNYLLAYQLWASADYNGAETLLHRNIDADAIVPASISLLGWIEVKREHYKRAGAHFLDALRREREASPINVRLVCTMVYAATNMAVETVDLPLGRKLRKYFDELTWPSSLGVDRFNTIGHFRVLSLLEGDLSDAWVLAREGAVRAPSVPYAAIGETNAGAGSRIIGDAVSAKLQFERAWEMLRKHRWGAADAETRVALTNFAYEAATEMPAEARKAMTLYDSLTERSFPENSLNADRRVAAFEAMASGRIAEVQGETSRAIRFYRESLAGWRELHFDMRAAMVALDLERITNDSSYRETVAPVLARAPKAWFAHRTLATIELLPDITPAEKLVLGLLLEGKSARAIANDLGRSVHTINNHTRKIFKAFGVTSRAAVLARCAAIGVTPLHFGRRA